MPGGTIDKCRSILIEAPDGRSRIVMVVLTQVIMETFGVSIDRVDHGQFTRQRLHRLRLSMESRRRVPIRKTLNPEFMR